MKKLNFRPIFYSFISLALGLYLARYIFSVNLFVLILIGLSIAVLVFLCVKNKCISRFIIVMSSFALGLGIFLISCLSFYNVNFSNKTCTVSGRISTVSTYSGFQSVVLDNVYIDGVKTNKCMIVSVENATTMETGYVITFTEYVEKTELFSLGEFNNYYYKYNIGYTVQTNIADVTMDSFQGLSISESLRESIRIFLNQNMDNEQASISYASLFGDKTYVNDSVKENFSISGIAHLLAISGLHIGFITSMLSFILDKTRMKKYINISIISVFLLFYCYLCSFSVSVVRASIMFLVLSIAGIMGKQYDRLNSLGIAGIITLLYKPLCVYDAGFLLSFGSVFSIFMFSVFFKELFNKCHFPKKLSETFSVMLSTQLGLLPLTVYYYGKMSFLTIVANFVCIPIFEVFFISLFVLIPISKAFSFGALLKIPALIISFITNVAQIIANQKWAIIDLSQLSPIVIIGIYFALFTSSHYINFNKLFKLLICMGFVVATLLTSFGMTIPKNMNKSISVLNAYGNNCYVLEFNGKTFCVGDFNKHLIKKNETYFKNIAHKNADYLILNSKYSYEKSDTFNNIVEFSATEEDECCFLYNVEYEFDNVKLTSIKIVNNLCGVMFEHDNFLVFVCNKNLSFEQLYEINMNYGKINLIISDCNYSNKSDLLVDNFLIDGKTIQNTQTINMTGCWTMSFKNNIIEKVWCLNWII